MRSNRVGWTKLVAALAIAGCGGSAGISQEQIGAEWHQANCRWQVRCGQMPDLDTCMAATRSPLGAQTAADLAAGKVIYNPTAGQALVSALDGLACRRSEVDGYGTGFIRALTAEVAAFRGAVPVSGDCSVDEQCASGSCDANQGGSCMQGKCLAPPSVTAPPPSTCSAAASTCVEGTICMLDAKTGTGACVVPTVGQPCADALLVSCGPGLACNDDAPNGPICQAYPPSGAACVPDSLSVPCDDTHDSCDPSTDTCQPTLAPGAACTLPGLYCGGGSWCDTTSGTCRPLGRLGDPCTADYTAGGCIGDLRCNATTYTCALEPDVTPCP
jgi:hypothetical protein